MNKKGTYFTLIVITIICGSFLNWKYCCNPPVTDVSPVVTENKPLDVPKKTNPAGIAIIDSKGDFKFTHADHFSFLSSSAILVKPISQHIDAGLQKLQVYLEKHPQKNVIITGYYKSDEKYDGALPNLGLARATAVKNYLTTKNISSSQLMLKSSLKESMTLSEDTRYDGPVEFQFSAETNRLEEELALLKQKIQADPLILYFNTGESNIQLSISQKQKIVNISRYLDIASGKSTIITGHTDNVGDELLNTQLGQKRAEFAKNYLIKNGIAATKIITESKGPLEPIADNATSEGRSKNRRTVININ